MQQPSSGTLALALFLVASLIGCTSTGPSDIRQLDAARARWTQTGLDNRYQAEVTRACYCGFPGAFSRTRIEVVNGNIVGAWEVESGNPVPPGSLGDFPTVQELFDLIATAIASNAALVRVEYDPTHGAPMQIYIDRVRNAIDDELAVTIHLLDDGVLDASPALLP